jgi:hypothetical protein
MRPWLKLLFLVEFSTWKASNSFELVVVLEWRKVGDSRTIDQNFIELKSLKSLVPSPKPQVAVGGASRRWTAAATLFLFSIWGIVLQFPYFFQIKKQNKQVRLTNVVTTQNSDLKCSVVDQSITEDLSFFFSMLKWSWSFYGQTHHTQIMGVSGHL